MGTDLWLLFDHGREALWHIRLAPGRRLLQGSRIQLHRQTQDEAGAAPLLALDTNAPPETLSQFTADGQAQAGAAEAAPGGAIGLLKGLEDKGMLVRRDTDTRIGHAQQQITLAPPVEGDSGAALLGKLDGVGEKILENLTDLGGIAIDPRRGRLSHVQAQGEHPCRRIGAKPVPALPRS